MAMTEIKLFGESGEELQEGTPIQLEVNKRTTLIAKSYPENATDKTIKWSSSDKSLFTVEDGGYYCLWSWYCYYYCTIRRWKKFLPHVKSLVLLR